MKFKYFLRGLGFGIAFASVIFLTAYENHSGEEISDEIIIERAKELGMVEQEDKVGDLLEDKNSTETDSLDSDNSETNASEQDTEETTEAETGTEDSETVDTEEWITEEQTMEDVSSSEEITTESNSNDTVTITVERGSSSYPVCQKLQEAGMIEDADEFDTYLVENGYANRIRVGEHVLTLGMDYHDIAEAIADPV